MAIVWLWFDQVLQIDRADGGVGGDHMVMAQSLYCTTSSYNEKLRKNKMSS